MRKRQGRSESAQKHVVLRGFLPSEETHWLVWAFRMGGSEGGSYSSEIRKQTVARDALATQAD